MLWESLKCERNAMSLALMRQLLCVRMMICDVVVAVNRKTSTTLSWNATCVQPWLQSCEQMLFKNLLAVCNIVLLASFESCCCSHFCRNSCVQENFILKTNACSVLTTKFFERHIFHVVTHLCDAVSFLLL